MKGVEAEEDKEGERKWRSDRAGKARSEKGKARAQLQATLAPGPLMSGGSRGDLRPPELRHSQFSILSLSSTITACLPLPVHPVLLNLQTLLHQ